MTAKPSSRDAWRLPTTLSALLEGQAWLRVSTSAGHVSEAVRSAYLPSDCSHTVTLTETNRRAQLSQPQQNCKPMKGYYNAFWKGLLCCNKQLIKRLILEVGWGHKSHKNSGIGFRVAYRPDSGKSITHGNCSKAFFPHSCKAAPGLLSSGTSC